MRTNRLGLLPALAAAAALTLLPAAALADDAPKRWLGLGGSLGMGFAALTSLGFGPAGLVVPYPDLGSVEVQAFNRLGHSVDISVPVVNSVATSAIVGGFIWQTDVFYNFNVGSSWVRLIAGPGLGVRVGAYSCSGCPTTVGLFSLRLPAELGVELLSPGRGFGFKILARPWAEVNVAAASEGGTTASAAVGGGGALLTLAWSAYLTTPR